MGLYDFFMTGYGRMLGAGKSVQGDDFPFAYGPAEIRGSNSIRAGSRSFQFLPEAVPGLLAAVKEFVLVVLVFG
jgi:hypothetical protein